MLSENLHILKNTYYQLYKSIKEIEGKLDKNKQNVEETKNGLKTISTVIDGRKIYLHSKYDPEKEAEIILKNLEDDIDKDTHIIFFGVGLGYHIKKVLDLYPKAPFSVYEPMPDIIYHFLNNFSLKTIPLKNLDNFVLGSDDASTKYLADKIVKKNQKILIIELPTYVKNFPEQHNRFRNVIREFVGNKKSEFATNYAFQKRWIVNSMLNFKEILSTPNILLEHNNAFRGKTAVLVAAGPSLDDEIENLRYIKDKGLAYIFTVGSAINTLINNGIYPHAASTYDPGINNQKVFEKLKQEGIDSIPLIFGTSVGFETLENYPGEKLHMITSQDTISQFFLRENNGEIIDGINDAPTIAVITLQLLCKLGFSKIVLVGQNFAYKGTKSYASKISYHENNEIDLSAAISVESVQGEKIFTSKNLNMMRQQMELLTTKVKNIRIINTTVGGAKIEGTEFEFLEQLIKKELKESIDRSYLKLTKTKYDKEYLNNQMMKLNDSFHKLRQMLSSSIDVLQKIVDLARNNNYKQIEVSYREIEKKFDEILENEFLCIIILPMNRVYYKLFSNETLVIKHESNQRKKAEKMIEQYGRILTVLEKDIVGIEDIYLKLNTSIEDYVK